MLTYRKLYRKNVRLICAAPGSFRSSGPDVSTDFLTYFKRAVLGFF